MPKTPAAPQHLLPATRAWWENIATTWRLDSHHLKLLTLAGEALDAGETARLAIARDGAYVTSSSGIVRKHPGLAVEQTAAVTFARLLRELDLDGAPLPDARVPRLRGSR